MSGADRLGERDPLYKVWIRAAQARVNAHYVGVLSATDVHKYFWGYHVPIDSVWIGPVGAVGPPLWMNADLTDEQTQTLFQYGVTVFAAMLSAWATEQGVDLRFAALEGHDLAGGSGGT